MSSVIATPDNLTVGSQLQDNDPRNPGRVITVTYIDFSHRRVGYRAGTRLAWIKLDRIFVDSKTRHQGYNLLSST